MLSIGQMDSTTFNIFEYNFVIRRLMRWPNELLLTRDGFVRFVLTQINSPINLHLEKVFAETVRNCFGFGREKARK